MWEFFAGDDGLKIPGDLKFSGDLKSPGDLKIPGGYWWAFCEVNTPLFCFCRVLEAEVYGNTLFQVFLRGNGVLESGF